MAKKIVLVINSLQGGGAEKFVLTLGEAFFAMGYEVHVVRFDPKIEHTLSDTLHYHLIEYKLYKWAKKGKMRNFIFAKVVDRYIKKHIGEPAMILVNLYREHEVFYYSHLNNIAYVIHNNLSDKLKLASLPPKQAHYYQQIYTKYPAICVSRGVQEDFVKNFGLDNKIPNPITSIYNPVDRESIEKLATAFMPAMTDYLVHVGSFKPQKGHEILLHAYAKSNQQKSLVLVGQGVLQPNIEALIKELGLEKRVTLVGFQPNPYPFIKHATGFVLSSHFEGFGLVLVEALALGVPTISTDCQSGPNELVPAHHLVPVADIQALAEKMNELMANPTQFTAPFEDKFLPQKVAKQYLDFMEIQSV